MKKSIIDKDDFIRKSKEVHGDKFDYSKVEYINSSTKVCIICPIHGEFKQTPYIHAIKGCGCAKCSKQILGEKYKNDIDQVINSFVEVHGNKYDYSKVKEDYVNMHKEVRIICPIHGEFKQTPHNHKNGSGCPICYSLNKKNGNPTFQQKPREHLMGCGCPIYANKESKDENEIYNFCKKIDNNTKQRIRTLINPYELDIFIPSKNIGIEYNGLYWHSEENGKDKNYHLNKLNLCKEKNIKLIQIFEDEYLNKKDIVLNKIKHILGYNDNKNKIFGRKCFIKEIDNETAKTFLNKYHIQGYVSSTIYLVSFYENKLVVVMTFKKENKDSLKWELNRFASDYNYICCGIGGKLFKYFVNKYNPIEIKSFDDRRWTIDEENNVYIKLGFKFDSYTKPDYSYYKNSDSVIRQHKFGFRKQILHKKYGLPLSMTENEMTTELGYYKIWNCGLIKYVWKNE